jgi:hypothetical protein
MDKVYLIKTTTNSTICITGNDYFYCGTGHPWVTGSKTKANNMLSHLKTIFPNESLTIKQYTLIDWYTRKLL